jgi:XTP/dITP diphosphohydrolase
VPRVLLATRSAGKIRELRALLGEARLAALTLEEAGIAYAAAEESIEQFATFYDNALAKARYFQAFAGELAVLAEDSGLEVSALGGRPGVHSKRWSGRQDLSGSALDAANNAHLIRALRGVADRSARYVCEAVWLADGVARSARGETAGEIVELPRGTNGFGYDPYFFSTELGCTFGEASAQAKARVSHRARAIRGLLGLRSDVER